MKIAFFDSKPYDIKSFSKNNESYGYDIKFFNERLTPDTAILANGYDIVSVFVNDDLSEKTIEILYKLNIKLIALRCAGYNNVDLKSVYKKIHTVRVPAYSPYAVAEHAVALLMSLNRKIHRSYFRTLDHNFSINGFTGFDLHGKTAGVVGTGKIGKVFIDIMLGFGVNVIAYDQYPDNDYARIKGIKYVELNELFSESDIISLHCPLTPESRYMINKESLSLMKSEVVILNTGRGPLIKTEDLIDALKEKRIGAAGLDVYEEESDYFFEDHSNEIIQDDNLARLLSFPNVLITSHLGFFTNEALSNISSTTFENIKAFLAGEPLNNEICYHCNSSVCVHKKNGRCF